MKLLATLLALLALAPVACKTRTPFQVTPRVGDMVVTRHCTDPPSVTPGAPHLVKVTGVEHLTPERGYPLEGWVVFAEECPAGLPLGLVKPWVKGEEACSMAVRVKEAPLGKLLPPGRTPRFTT